MFSTLRAAADRVRVKIFKSSNIDVYERYHFARQLKYLARELHRKQPDVKSFSSSQNAYESYGARELEDYESGSTRAVIGNRVVTLPHKEVRCMYVEALIAELERLAAPGPFSALEIGCGNCINAALLKDHFKDRIDLLATDLVADRYQQGIRHFGPRLDGTKFETCDITKRTRFDDGAFDFVFCTFCIEQITHDAREAFREMLRISKRGVIFIESIFEFGTPLQRIYLIRQDHCRNILSAIASLQMKPSIARPLSVQVSPFNQTSIVVLETPSLGKGSTTRAAEPQANSI